MSARLLVLVVAILTASVQSALADPPQLDSVNPPGVGVGGRETWTLTGARLGRVDRIIVEGRGISASVRSTGEDRVVADVRADPDATVGFRVVRVDGPEGMSNLRVIRVDRLSQIQEVEPNDSPETATALLNGAAGVGALGPTDLDHFVIEGRQGGRVVIDLEARRLGLDIAPVVAVLTPEGRSLTQRRETPGIEGDCRFPFTFPSNGRFVIQVRDHLYSSSTCQYRLRVAPEDFATAHHPLGGPPGLPLRVTISGGNLDSSRSRTLILPDRPGMIVNLPAFHDTIVPTGRLVVGIGQESGETVGLTSGVTVNGRLEHPGAIDHYSVNVKAGETVQLRMVAASLGSWLDSVVTVRDRLGRVIAENDDPPPVAGLVRFPNSGLEPSTDSTLTFSSRSDEVVTVEVADRFGAGGPEYSYRLTASPPGPDFSVVLTGDTSLAFNLRPGTSRDVPFVVLSEGRTGPITVVAEGLPSGVTAPRVSVRPKTRPNPEGERKIPETGTLTTGALRFVAGAGATSATALVRFVATAAPSNPPVLEREVCASVPIGLEPGAVQPARTVVRWRLTQFPVRVLP